MSDAGNVKPGNKTTEYKITLGALLTIAASMVAALAMAPVSAPVAIAAGMVAAGLASAGYSVSRGMAKRNKEGGK